MNQNELFSILDSVDSTNNYATGQVHAGLATHGRAWYANEQFAGKGQRGKIWKSTSGKNITMSVIIKPDKAFDSQPFLFSALIADTCLKFFSELAGDKTKIKWPNDIYWRDRKAGGILIENVFRGKEWKWAVAGIGININQVVFDEDSRNAVSLKNITGLTYDTVKLAKGLHEMLMGKLNDFKEDQLPEILNNYNFHLYKKGEAADLKKENDVFSTTVLSVNACGQLQTKDTAERSFDFGEVQWVI